MPADLHFQHTLAKSASLTGLSLHTGEKVTLTLHPAPADSGYKFRRTDLPDSPTIDVVVRNVKQGERASVLSEGTLKVQTPEHVLSALSGLGIDNALIELDGNEPPICDGSAQPFVEMIEAAGIVKQDAPTRFFDVREPIHVESKSGALLTVVPDSKFRITCTQSGPEGRFTQFFSLEITPETYAREIARARTFVYEEDVQPLLEKGLIKGGSLDNAVVIKGEKVFSKEPMRFKEEFVRHKILDIVGDLALFGTRLRGHVIATRPGHAANAELCKALAKEHARMLAMVPPLMIPKGEGVLDVNDVMKILPHRYPFLMVDRIVAFEGDNKCTGVKNVTINEPFFQGHFPGHPVMPGVLQVEAMAQVASVILLRQSGAEGNIGYFMSADNVKFRKPVFPGDTLFIHVELTKARRNLGKAACRCEVNNEVVSEGDLLFGIVQR